MVRYASTFIPNLSIIPVSLQALLKKLFLTKMLFIYLET